MTEIPLLVITISILLVSTVLLFLQRRRRFPVMLLGYSCHLPDSDRRCTLDLCEYLGARLNIFDFEATDFMRLIYKKSGVGQETYMPPYLMQPVERLSIKHPTAIQEAEEGLFSTVSALLCKTDLAPQTITHVIVACSLFSPSPSLSALLINRFGFSESVKTYTFSGMGCSAGTMCVDFAARLLRHQPGYALIVVTESMGVNWYFGNNRHMLVTNCIFRVGSAALILTSDPTQRPKAKMELVLTQRTHHGADDSAYGAAIQMDDEDGMVGVALTKDLIRVAGTSLRRHISTLAPHVLPLSEMVRYAYRVAKSYLSRDKKAASMQVPDFTKAFDHICFHAGGKAVIDSVGKLMKFDRGVLEPARMTLHRFGNTSSSLVFYELAYFEAKGRIKKGDSVWMLAFGTGFKACSVVWRALKDSSMDPDNPWINCIHRYPVS
ncbi:3-ketoacyl-CoA synthase [Rhynchospora pubera]|uniref:3-ketoacyl-CoA synthase n=1 Tax=Rhynchospora pubera TaxID=906938 RepID=A0AAV8H7F0_9POAL|nr:3-ketoacyl-CoA synthase [Rhynchospora pubera]